MAIVIGLLTLIGCLLQLALLFEGLNALGRLIIPFIPKEKLGWFGLWGAWHLGVFTLLFEFAHAEMESEMKTFQSVAFQAEGLQIVGMYLLLPLLVSFLFSQTHLYVRSR